MRLFYSTSTTSTPTTMVSMLGGKSSASIKKLNVFNVISKVSATGSAGGLAPTDATPISPAENAATTKPIVTAGSKNRLSYAQALALTTVHDSYSLLLAQKKYESISTNYMEYLALLKTLKTIDLRDTTMNILLRIAEDAILGAVNSVAVNVNFSYTQLKMITLNKYIDDILADKNVKSALSEGISGNIAASKVFKLSPLFSYYIILYGMPAKGVGFDPEKLAFIQSLPELTITGGTNIPIVQSPIAPEYAAP